MTLTINKNLSGPWKPLNSDQRVDILVITELNQIWPFISKEKSYTAPHVLITKSLLGKLSHAWTLVWDLISPQFAICLWTWNILFVPPSVLWVWNENNSLPFVTRVLWTGAYFWDKLYSNGSDIEVWLEIKYFDIFGMKSLEIVF